MSINFGRRFAVTIMRKSWPTRPVVIHHTHDNGAHSWLVSWRRTVVVFVANWRKVHA